MATEKLSVVLELVSGQYKKEAKEAATATGQIGNAAKSSTTGISGLSRGMDLLKGAVAAVGVTRLIGEFRDMAIAASEDAEAQEVLANALRTNVGATDEMIGSTEKWISSMQIATRTADTDLRQAITDLTVAGRGLEEAQVDVGIAIDIAASKGIALDSVIKSMVRSLATGSTTGLGRLGIETKNAAGEMLTYDQVLQNAAGTMGGTAARAAGTLAGALERAAIATEEAKEEAGADFLPGLVALTDGWNELTTGILGGNKALAGMITTFNTLLRQGIDPFADQVGSAETVVANFLNEFRIPLDAGTFDTLVTMLGLTNDQVIQLRSNFILNGEALVNNEEDLVSIIGVLDEYVGNVDPAILSTRRFQEAQREGAGTTRDYTAAIQAQRDLLREMTNPVFALIGANERYEDAQRRLNELTIEGKEGSAEYQGALGDLLQSQIDLNEAQANANEVGSEGLDLLEQYAAQAGINMAAFDAWRDSVDLLAGSIANLPASVGTVNTITGNQDRPGAFHSGGVVPGPRGMERLALVQAGEMIVPLGQVSGGSVTNNRTGPTIIVQTPMRNFAQDLQYASLLANIQTLV